MTNSLMGRYAPASVLAVGCLMALQVHKQERAPLAQPLTAIPSALGDYSSKNVEISPEEQRAAGMDSYVMRLYRRDSSDYFTLYVGYYEAQTRGRSIHSPKNCLPGAGWEPVSAGTTAVRVADRVFEVNRYVIANGQAQALVYYWYQGRGRISANEYRVKWELLRDKALFGRSEEALVRIVVPVIGPLESAEEVAGSAARNLILPIFSALPPAPGAGA